MFPSQPRRLAPRGLSSPSSPWVLSSGHGHLLRGLGSWMCCPLPGLLRVTPSAYSSAFCSPSCPSQPECPLPRAPPPQAQTSRNLWGVFSVVYALKVSWHRAGTSVWHPNELTSAGVTCSRCVSHLDWEIRGQARPSCWLLHLQCWHCGPLDRRLPHEKPGHEGGPAPWVLTVRALSLSAVRV